MAEPMTDAELAIVRRQVKLGYAISEHDDNASKILARLDRAEARGAWRPMTDAVQVNASDFDGDDWDGSPFSAMPDWLAAALGSGCVRVKPGSYDYAIWRVGPPDRECDDVDIDTNLARPGDWIVRLPDGHIIRLDDRAYRQLAPLPEPPRAGEGGL